MPEQFEPVVPQLNSENPGRRADSRLHVLHHDRVEIVGLARLSRLAASERDRLGKLRKAKQGEPCRDHAKQPPCIACGSSPSFASRSNLSSMACALRQSRSPRLFAQSLTRERPVAVASEAKAARALALALRRTLRPCARASANAAASSGDPISQASIWAMARATVSRSVGGVRAHRAIT